MKKILVPIDFSENTRKASEYAARLAKAFDATLQLLHVYLEPAAIGEVPLVWMMTESQLQEDYETLVQKEITYLRQKFRVAVEGQVTTGFKSEEICALAAEMNADLIIMGNKGSSKSRFMNSTTTATLRRTRVPVLVVPENADYTPIRQIAFATDYNEKTNPSSYKLLFEIAQRFNSVIRIVNVKEKPEMMRAHEIAGRMRLENVMSSLPHEYYTVPDRNVESGIQTFLRQHPSDLLVMVAHQHHILEYLLGTIHTRSMCSQTNLPLLILEDQ